MSMRGFDVSALPRDDVDASLIRTSGEAERLQVPDAILDQYLWRTRTATASMRSIQCGVAGVSTSDSTPSTSTFRKSTRASAGT